MCVCACVSVVEVEEEEYMEGGRRGREELWRREERASWCVLVLSVRHTRALVLSFALEASTRPCLRGD